MESSPYTRCIRCGGAMAYEIFYGSNESFWGFKCVICGEIVDPVILQDRQMVSAGQEIIHSSTQV
jgi:hypothetical protein